MFFVSGDVEALRSARRAPFVAATTREQPTLLQGGVPIDLLVGSLNDAGERFEGGLDVRTVVLTDGARGGVANGEHLIFRMFGTSTVSGISSAAKISSSISPGRRAIWDSMTQPDTDLEINCRAQLSILSGMPTRKP